MDPWESNQENFDNLLFQDSDLTAFMDTGPSGTLEADDFMEPQQLETLDGFDFSFQNSSSAGDFDAAPESTYNLPTNVDFKEDNTASACNSLLVPGDNFHLPALIFSSDGSQDGLEFSSLNTQLIGPSGGASNQENSHSVTPNLYDHSTTQTSAISKSATSKTSPKPKKTRKRKTFSDQQQKDKKNAFLERNRMAAKKCRIKKKSWQEYIQEECRRLAREKVEREAILSELQKMRDETMDELSPYRAIPQILEEIEAIKAGCPKRSPMFMFQDAITLLPISPSDSNYISHATPRDSSNDSVCMDENAMQDSPPPSHANVNSSHFSRSPPQNLESSSQSPCSDSDPLNSNQEVPRTRVVSRTKKGSWSHAKSPSISHQEFPLANMDLASSSSLAISSPTGWYQTPYTEQISMNKKSSRVSYHDSMPDPYLLLIDNNKDITVQTQRNSNRSTPSMSRSNSVVSASDSGLGDISPTTPQAQELSLSDEGIVTAATIPIKMTGLMSSKDYLGSQGGGFLALRL